MTEARKRHRNERDCKERETVERLIQRSERDRVAKETEE